MQFPTIFCLLTLVGTATCAQGLPAEVEEGQWSEQFYPPETKRFDARTRAIVARPAGGIFYGGTFRSVAGLTNTAGIAEWNGKEWRSLGTGLGEGSTGSIECMAVQGDDLYVGGTFTNIGGGHNTNIARWDGTAGMRLERALVGG